MNVNHGHWSKARILARAGIVALGLSACGDVKVTFGDILDGGDDMGGTDAMETATSDASGGEGTGDGTGDGLTSGDEPTTGETEGEVASCEKIDFLFVIDNSISMQDEQDSLSAAFPGFMEDVLATVLPGGDYHVMVVDTDRWGRCDTANGWEGHSPGHSSCNDYIEQTAFDTCDGVRGAGVVHPAGALSSNRPCEPQGDNRYIVQGEPDLADTFACMAKVGTAGHPSERPMDAMVMALDPSLNEPEGCNAGFLRDDALLVVTFISDDPHREDTGEPQDWYEAVLDAKGGDPSAAVVLGMTPAWDGCLDGHAPTRGQHWVEFIELWGDAGIHGNVCGAPEEYEGFFADAIEPIGQACAAYVPPA